MLRRAAELELRLTAVGDVLVSTEDGQVSGGQDWIDVTAAIVRLHEEGVLRADGEPEGAVDRASRPSFDSPRPHGELRG